MHASPLIVSRFIQAGYRANGGRATVLRSLAPAQRRFALPPTSPAQLSGRRARLAPHADQNLDQRAESRRASTSAARRATDPEPATRPPLQPLDPLRLDTADFDRDGPEIAVDPREDLAGAANCDARARTTRLGPRSRRPDANHADTRNKRRPRSARLASARARNGETDGPTRAATDVRDRRKVRCADARRSAHEAKRQNGKSPRVALARSLGLLWEKSRRRPTLPHGYPCSTIGSEELNFRVRDGIGCGLFEITTGNCGIRRDRACASRAGGPESVPRRY